ncbi:transglycosylase domain-containing protein [Aquimixticola soesokkakensis]|nr:transglycosylase domain-containing protein [Aquimixticola soesokkakensis]
MAGNSGGSRRLVADKRYPAGKPATAGSKAASTASRRKARGGSGTGGGAGKPPRKPRNRATATPRKRPSNPILRLFHFLFGWIFRLIFALAWRGALIVALLLGGAVFYFYAGLPPLQDQLDGRQRGSVTMMDRSGQVFAWRGEQFGGQITADTVSPNLKNAIVATEDRRFYRHFGISPRGIASAIRINLREGRGPLSGHGGSTLTQQTAKLLCLGVPFDASKWKNQTEYEADCRETTLVRKIKEMIYAMALEAKYSKSEILTIYMNRAYLGAGANGFEAASQRYFGKSAAEVDIAEAAMLAGLLSAPSRYAPTSNLQRSQDRAAVVVNLMDEQGYITDAQRDAAKANPAELSEAAEARAGGYYADWIMSSGPSFLTSDTTEDVVIKTTFDSRIQKAAEDAVQYIFDNKVKEGSEAQAAIVVMSSDGAVRAMVGGRKFKGVAGQFNRAIQANRQTGSSFKPFVYAAALEMGWRYDSVILDDPLTVNIPGSGPWSPKNYTNSFVGPMTLTDALAKSQNIPAVKLAMDVGLDNVRTVAEMFGIKSDLAAGPALALGASESTLMEMTGAYAGILNGGTSVTPYGLLELRLQGDETPLMGQEGGMGERVISTESAEQLIYMMYQGVERGTGTRARIDGLEIAGKSGTTSAARDAWYMGFTADYVVGVWMGYDDNRPLTGVTGGGLPAEIWHETMVRVQGDTPGNPLPMIRPATQPSVTPQVAGQDAPASEGQTFGAGPQYNQPQGGGQVQTPEEVIKGIGDAAEKVFGDVLRNIFGGN